MKRETGIIRNWRNALVLAFAIAIGGGVLLLAQGQTASPAQPPPTSVIADRPDNSWEVRFIGVRGRRLSRVYDPAYSAEEALAAFRNEYGPREVLCVARRSHALCDVIDRPPGK